jgi:hypothetical protein
MNNPTCTPRITPEQKEFLKTCPPEQQQQRAALLAYRNLFQQYRRQEQQYQPTEEDFTRWLATLPRHIAWFMRAHGFEGCKHTPLFMRFVRRKYEQDLSTYLQQYMSPHEYETALRLVGRRPK